MNVAASLVDLSSLSTGGALFIGTLNRTPQAYALAIIGAEYVLRWLPRGTHEYSRLVRPEELEAEPFILREPGSGTRLVMGQALRECGFDPARLRVVAEMGSSEAVRQAIRFRLGISILSSLAVAEDVQRGDLATVPLEGVRIRRPFYLVRRRGRQLSPLALAFYDHLRERGAG